RQIAALVADLGADLFTTRQRSEIRLVDIATRDSGSAEAVKAVLRDNPFPPQDLELFLGKKRLLERLESSDREVRIDRFLHDPSFDQRLIPGWEQFRQFAGDGIDARLVFAALIQHHPQVGRRLGSPDGAPIQMPDFDSIDRDDTATWTMLLWASIQQSRRTIDDTSIRLTASLCRVGGGPEPLRDHERRVVSRLIASYLTRAPIDVRDRMVIGLRYGCTEIVHQDCRQILTDPSESPSRIVTAMLAASVIDLSPSETDQWINSFLTDWRVSHVWRSMMPPKTTHRTQVRDVALALQLHRSGIDPRTRGFEALVADPILVFRPYSLGFESDDARSRAHDGKSLTDHSIRGPRPPTG
ncbi:MAG: hypothetical protein KDB00_11920, partial [Planctomycetales bacterium]|nr:hypothetical protein [Planctomycetales bacterium]